MNKYYLNDWKNSTKDEILDEFEFEGNREELNVLFATYTYEDWEGDAFLIVEKNNQLYEVNAWHCSCYELEQQFDLEETSIEALEEYLKGDKGLDYWNKNNIYRDELVEFIKQYKRGNRYGE